MFGAFIVHSRGSWRGRGIWTQQGGTKIQGSVQLKIVVLGTKNKNKSFVFRAPFCCFNLPKPIYSCLVRYSLVLDRNKTRERLDWQSSAGATGLQAGINNN